jgi:hypothetical protein
LHGCDGGRGGTRVWFAKDAADGVQHFVNERQDRRNPKKKSRLY